MTISEAATRYRKIGWNVIPLFKHSKNPLDSTYCMPEDSSGKRGWLPLQFRMSSDFEFDYWFKKLLPTGLGVICGKTSNLTVIDNDLYAKGSLIWDGDSVLKSKTASGGIHYFYRYNPAIGQLGANESGIECKNDGGFIVLPPSKVIRKIDGGIGTYEWLTKEKIDPAKLPYLDPKLVDKYRPQTSNGHVDINSLLKSSKGSRHDNLRTLALSWLNKFNPQEWEASAYPYIRKAAEDFDPPLDDREVEQVINDASRYILNNPKSNTLSSGIDNALRSDPTYYSKISDLTDFPSESKLKTGLNKIDSVLHLYPGYYLICAMPGVGKSWFAIWLARKLFEQNNLKTVLFSLEMSEIQIRRRLLQAWSGLTQDQFEQGFPTNKAQVLMKKDLLVIDPFGEDDAFYRTPENFEKDLGRYYEQGYRIFEFDHFHEIPGSTVNDSNQKVSEEWGLKFQSICKKYPDIWLVIFAQPNATAYSKKILRKEDVRGSKALTYKCDCVVSLNREVKTDQTTNEIKVTEDNREILIWIDKHRKSEKSLIGTKVYFSKTGNFAESEHLEKYLEEKAQNTIEKNSSEKWVEIIASGATVRTNPDYALKEGERFL